MEFTWFSLTIVLLHAVLGSAETCENGALFPNPSNCGAFYECAQGELVEIQCPDGLHFNTADGWCDYPELANCQLTEVPNVCSPFHTTEIDETDYTTFIDVRDIERGMPNGDSKLVISVQATSDISFLLSSGDSNSDESYEIRMATGTDQRDNEIYRNHERLYNERSINMFEPNIFVPMNILITRDGTIEVSAHRSAPPFMRFHITDPNPINVRFVSFRSNIATQTSDWWFEC